MDEQKQDSRKTVVAFVAGLLIGGLLVWLFSGSPEAEAPERISNDTTAAVREAIDLGGEEVGQMTDKPENDTAALAPQTTPANPDGFTFSVANQSAGAAVSLGESIQYPSAEGWIAVHEEVGGELGNVLGAARFDTALGLMPKSVELLRATEAGKTYRVVYYNESGDRAFSKREDTPLTRADGSLIEASFTAE